MTPVADYRCRECSSVLELDVSHGPIADAEHATDAGVIARPCTGRLDRVWTAPHTGRGSAGEPPR